MNCPDVLQEVTVLDAAHQDEQGDKENQQWNFYILHRVIHFNFACNEDQQGQPRGRNHPGFPADLVVDDE